MWKWFQSENEIMLKYLYIKLTIFMNIVDHWLILNHLIHLLIKI